MEVIPNQDHRMPQHIDVFDHISECARKNLCCVWGCGKTADINDYKIAPNVTTPFTVPFCTEHQQGFLQANKKATEGELDDGSL